MRWIAWAGRGIGVLSIVALGAWLAGAIGAHADVFTSVTIPTSNNIQTGLISTFPTGTFIADNALATPFSIPSTSSPSDCGPSNDAACNFYEGFTGTGSSITINVSIPDVTDVYTLINAYITAAFIEPETILATIEFVDGNGDTETFDLVIDDDIRNFEDNGTDTEALNEVSLTGVTAENAFTCSYPDCLGSFGTGNVNTGAQGTYNIDEQGFALDSDFATYGLDQIIITDEFNNATPILLGITAASPTAVPEPASLSMFVAGLVGLGALRRRRKAV